MDSLHGFITIALKFEKKLDKLQEDLTYQNKAISDLTDIITLLTAVEQNKANSEIKPKKKAVSVIKTRARSLQFNKVLTKLPQPKSKKTDYKQTPKFVATKLPQNQNTTPSGIKAKVKRRIAA